MPQEQIYYPKELSWLSFNERVLQEASDKNNPIVERIRFLGIYSSNMDEFYRVRVAEVKRQIYIYLDEGNEEAAQNTKELMERIQQKVLSMTGRFEKVYADIVKGLARYNIYLIDKDELTDFQKDWLIDYFRNKIVI